MSDRWNKPKKQENHIALKWRGSPVSRWRLYWRIRSNELP